MTVAELNLMAAARAESEMARCCGSKRWAHAMVSERPYSSRDALLAIAERLWWSLDTADWLEAFAAHPRIGERATSVWSAEEQSAASATDGGVRERLAHGNREYERLFGYTFLICATGKPAAEIADALERRMTNEPAHELQIAAAEQRRITELRLMKLVTP